MDAGCADPAEDCCLKTPVTLDGSGEVYLEGALEFPAVGDKECGSEFMR